MINIEEIELEKEVLTFVCKRYVSEWNVNFLKETYNKIIEIGKTENDIAFIGCGNEYMNWQDFCKNANFYYNNSFGGPIITNLQIAFVDSTWLERMEYDGSEWWEYKKIFSKGIYNQNLHLREE